MVMILNGYRDERSGQPVFARSPAGTIASNQMAPLATMNPRQLPQTSLLLAARIAQLI